MTMGLGTLTGAITKVISAAAAQAVINAVTPGPGWTTIGRFYMPQQAACVLRAVGLVSTGSNTLSCRLYDVGNAQVFSGSNPPDITATSDTRSDSGTFTLPPGLYQFQAQVIGASGTGTVSLSLDSP